MDATSLPLLVQQIANFICFFLNATFLKQDLTSFLSFSGVKQVKSWG